MARVPLPTAAPPERARGPEDAARLALFLASPASAPLTGRHLDVGMDWQSLVGHVEELMATERLMLKRLDGPGGPGTPGVPGPQEKP